MSKQPGRSSEPIAVARIVRTHGIHGEVAAQLLTDFPERFARLHTVVLAGAGKEPLAATLKSFRFHRDRILLEFDGYTTPEEAAAALVGREVRIAPAEATELGPNQYYDFDLQDCQVVDSSGLEVGRVTGILRAGESANLVMRCQDESEVMIPMVDRFVKSVDLASRRIVVDLPEELRQLNKAGSRLRKGTEPRP
ncbi:MAG: ribosome maturation factor RimM [Acidobacteriota bacterium]